MKLPTRLFGKGLLAFLLLGLSSSHGFAAEDAAKAPALLKVTVPEDALVEFDGVVTKQKGSVRLFITPDLAKGKKYSYQIKATFNKDGKPVTVEKTVTVEPSVEAVVDLTRSHKAAAATKKAAG